MNGIIIGNSTYGIAIGGTAYFAPYGISIGKYSCTTAYNAIAFGACSRTTRPYEIWQRTNTDISPVGGISGQGLIGLKRDNLAGTAGYVPLYLIEGTSKEFEFTAAKNSILTFSSEIAARTTDASFVVGFTINGTVRVYSAGTAIALVGVPEITQYDGDADVDVTVDVATAPLRLRFMVKDKVGRTLHWSASMKYTELAEA